MRFVGRFLMALVVMAFASNIRALDVQQDWVVQFDTPEWNESFGIVQVDPSGALRVTGGAGYLKYSADGGLLWRIPDVHCQLVDEFSNCYGIRWVPGTQLYDTVKLDSEGNVVWARRDLVPGGSASEMGYHDFAFDPVGNIVVASRVFSGQWYIQFVKYAPDGTPLSGSFEQTQTESYPAGVEIDSSGEIALGFVKLEPPGFGLVRYAPDGTRLWQTFVSCATAGPGKQVALDSFGNVFLLTSLGVHKYSPAGQQVAFVPVELGYGTLGVAVDFASNVIAFGVNGAGAASVRKFDNVLMPLWEFAPSGVVYDMKLDGFGHVFLAGVSGGGPASRVTSWVLNPDGQTLTTPAVADVPYAWGNAVAIVNGTSFYVAGTSWNASTYYGGVLLKYSWIDTSPPTTALTEPVPGAKLGGSVTVSATASDDLGVTLVEFYFGSTLIGSDTTAPYSIIWDTSPFSGSGYLRSRAYDAAGNNTWSQDVPVKTKR